MSAKAIREFHGKRLVSRHLPEFAGADVQDLEDRVVQITASTWSNPDGIAMLEQVRYLAVDVHFVHLFLALVEHVQHCE
jgi:hypothetical protein